MSATEAPGGVTFLGVRHHSPACARLVAATVARLRPAYVLVEGPADLNGRMDELLGDHELPIAVFTAHREGTRRHASWSPFCAYSPEWVALTAGRQVGAQLRFIDLPAWHPALSDRANRYADADQRYAEAVRRLCATLAVDNVDALWDHLFEIGPDDGLAERLDTYFDVLRGESAAGEDDTAREAYMARWVRAARRRAAGRPVLVVTGGFHRPALVRLTAGPDGADPDSDGPEDDDWPEVPAPAPDAVAGSYLVPYSFRRLDAFVGYQSGMPSPAYYQRVWEDGPRRAAEALTEAVAARLRARRQPVSTADLIAARTMAGGLARLRGHAHPGRVDVLDGLVSALVTDALDQPLPWATRGTLTPGAHPVVVEMVAALSGDRVGRLHPDTPLPPLVHDVDAELARHRIDPGETVELDLTVADDLARSRLLHRLRLLDVPGHDRERGPRVGADALLTERWSPAPSADRLARVIEAGGYGPTVTDAVTARIEERVTLLGADVDALATTLFDTTLAGLTEHSTRTLTAIARATGSVTDLRALGRALAVALALWRHDRLLGSAGTAPLGALITAAVRRALWLVEGVRAAAAPADPGRLATLVAVRDAIRHAGPALGLDRDGALAVAGRIAADTAAPPDLRGAALGLAWSLGDVPDAARAVRAVAAPDTLGDWLSGLFALAREQVVADDAALLTVVDEMLAGMGAHDFLVALPALRQAFGWFPPRERATVARHVQALHGGDAPPGDLLRLDADPLLVAAARAVEERVDAVLIREGLWEGNGT
ncbi:MULTISPECIES: DUF5682 family protein [unclassified Micromonospora]|uniref:DUF5682 family protein n=1 Tax=unclassified Micromonospora TaxID=2617518 RepID=UPI001B37BA4A|nr:MULTISPECIES: DUF5682 family protein [unclassified Micromonospora]MBQ1043123.1 hypothetical protein [Micromonospora sp. C72]MBQ1056771.1 hypothetical protein [Micromonospora sp. C32]